MIMPLKRFWLKCADTAERGILLFFFLFLVRAKLFCSKMIEKGKPIKPTSQSICNINS